MHYIRISHFYAHSEGSSRASSIWIISLYGNFEFHLRPGTSLIHAIRMEWDRNVRQTISVATRGICVFKHIFKYSVSSIWYVMQGVKTGCFLLKIHPFILVETCVRSRT